MTTLAQFPLFGSQPVHLGRVSQVTGVLICAICKVSLVLAAEWDFTCCPGFIASAPAWRGA